MKPLIPDPKPETERDEDFLNFIRALPCVICEQPAEPHHESGLIGSGGGMALKCSDYYTIPLCRGHHNLRENIGFQPFYLDHYKDPYKIVMNNLIKYIKWEFQSPSLIFIIDFLIGRIKDANSM